MLILCYQSQHPNFRWKVNCENVFIGTKQWILCICPKATLHTRKMLSYLHENGCRMYSDHRYKIKGMQRKSYTYSLVRCFLVHLRRSNMKVVLRFTFETKLQANKLHQKEILSDLSLSPYIYANSYKGLIELKTCINEELPTPHV